jgi:chromosome segregation protein
MERAMQEWQHGWDAFTLAANEAGRNAMVARARIEQLETRLGAGLQRQERVQAEQQSLATQDVAQQLAALVEREAQAVADGRAAQARLAAVIEALQKARQDEHRAQAELDRARAELQRARGQLVSLEALQQAALGRVKGRVVDWLARHALDARPRLAQQLAVESGWARAVETVLGNYLEAVCVDGLDSVTAFLDDLKVGQVTFVGLDAAAAGAIRPASSLYAKVQGPAALASLLQGILAAVSQGGPGAGG